MSLNWSVTTSPTIVCHKCRKFVNGEEGYACLLLYDHSHRLYYFKLNLCEKCFSEGFQNKNTAKERYSNLVKKRVIGKLR